MSVYVMAQLCISDPERYQRYAAAVPGTLAPYGGDVVVADSEPELLEGADAPDRVVLLRFPTREAAREWAESTAYRRIAVDRRAATTATVLAVRGLARHRSDR